MSAETLRKAAALMRERAEAATPGPWVIYGRDGEQYVAGKGGEGDLVLDGSLLPLGGWHACLPDVEHIASWHPAVALAVADWLDHEAEMHAEDGDLVPNCDNLPHALAVARAYLGQEGEK